MKSLRHNDMLVGGLAAGLLVSCLLILSSIGARPRTTITNRVTVNMIDLTGFHRLQTDPSPREVNDQVQRSAAGDVVVALAITANSQATANTAVSCTAPTEGGQENSYNFSERRTAYVRTFKKRLNALIGQQPSTKNSDLLGAAVIAGNVFRSPEFRAVPEKRLNWISDMANQTGKLDLLSEDLTPKHLPVLIQRLRDQGLVPDLTGVHISVIGACACNPPLSPAKSAEIREFWVQYFKAAHADFNLSDWNANLLAASS